MKFDENLINKIKALSPEELARQGVITLAEKKVNGNPTAVCEFCGNGTGKDKDGIAFENKGGVWLGKCFKCDTGFDNIKLLAIHYGLDPRADFQKICLRAADDFGIAADSENFSSYHNLTPIKNNSAPPTKKTAPDAAEKKAVEYNRLSESRKNLVAFIEKQGGKWRGLSLDLLQRLNWGFLQDFSHPKSPKDKFSAVIIPNDKGGIFARAVASKKYSNVSPTATTTIFLPSAETFDCVVVEGAINGASILQADPAPNFGIIASGGTSGNKNVVERLQELQRQGKKIRVLVAYDNDTGKAGQNATAKLLEMLKGAGFTAVTIDITKTADIDLNDVLKNQGSAELAKIFNSAVTIVQDELKKVDAEMEKDFDLNAQIESLKRQRQEVFKKISDFESEKESAIEDLKNTGVFDKDTAFSEKVITAAAFAKLYDGGKVFSDYKDGIKKTGEKTGKTFLQDWNREVAEKVKEISSRAANLRINANELSAKINSLEFVADNDILKENGLRLPDTFSITENGEIVKFLKGNLVTICRAPVVISKKYFGLDTDFYKLILAYKDKCGWKELPPIEKATIADSRKIVPAVANFYLNVNSVNASGVVDYLDAFLAENAEKFPIVYTSQKLGWQSFNGKEIFLDPRRKIEIEKDGAKGELIADFKNQFSNSLTSAGSVEEWWRAYDLIKKYPIARARAALYVATPLLKIFDEENFLFYTYAGTGAGKTTTLLFGVSAVGSKKMVRTFDATKNSLTGAAIEFNDYCLPIDEKQVSDPKLILQIPNLVYSNASGKGRGRQNKSGENKEIAEFRLITDMTGEDPLLADNVTGGALRRTLQLNPPKEYFPPSEVCKEVKEIIAENYGHALPLVIDKYFNYGFDNLRKCYKDTVSVIIKNYPSIIPEYCRYIAIITVADFCLNMARGVEEQEAYDSANLNAEKLLDITPTIAEISDVERAKEFVISFIVQHSAHFEKSENFNKDRGLEIFGKINQETGYGYIIATILERFCNSAGYSYKTVYTNLINDGFFITGSKADKDRKKPRPTVQEEEISNLGKPRCFKFSLKKLRNEGNK